MSRYIDADKAKNGIMRFVDKYGYICGMSITDFNILLERSRADVAEVKRGQWKPFDLTYGRSIYFCTACNDAAEVPTFNGKPMNYRT